MKTTPAFERPWTSAEPPRRLLLISYHFPPDSSVGARRWEKLSHFAAERGWATDVITRGDLPPDRERMNALPAGMRVYTIPPRGALVDHVAHALWRVYRSGRDALPKRAPATTSSSAPTPAPTTRPERLRRTELRWPPRSGREIQRVYWTWREYAQAGAWAREAASLGIALQRASAYDAVITSAPPHMTHDAGFRIARETGIPHIMDMRDPWSRLEQLAEHTASPLWYFLAERHEARIIHAARLVAATTEPARLELCATYPELDGRIITVMNGADEDELPQLERRAQFVIAYAGTVYLSDEARALFRGAARVIQRLGLTPADFRIEFMGASGEFGLPLLDIARSEGVGDFVVTHERGSHREALTFLAGAAMLAIFAGPNSISISAKTFEYSRFDAWVLALAARGTATELLLRGTSADVVDPADTEALAAIIEQRYHAHRRGERPTNLLSRFPQFSRAQQARVLFDAIEGALAQDRAGGAPRSVLAMRS